MSELPSTSRTRADLPTGKVALMFTDIEGSTRLLQLWGADYAAQLEAHRRIVRAALDAHQGVEVDTQGDSFFAVFRDVSQAIDAAIQIQHSLNYHPWPSNAVLRVRIGLHIGEPTATAEGYVGLDVHRTARLMSAGHGGQILLSSAAATELKMGASNAHYELRDLGEHRLKSLPHPERIYEVRIGDLPQRFPPLRSLEARPHNLPAHLTPILGRESEIETLCARLEKGDGLITLLGPGGTGKTRLSLEVAALTLESWDDGAFFVPLAPIAFSGVAPATHAIEEAIGGAVARALGLREDGLSSAAEQVAQHLKERQILLVLDNFEHLVGGASVVACWRARCPHLAVLASSRRPLHITGEREFPVAPLALPRRGSLPQVEVLEQFGAVALFVERAREVQPNFALTPDNARAITEICARLDGLPLAIELAAARIKLLSPAALLARLEENALFLRKQSRDRTARQQTLRAAIGWSYDLLDEDEKILFRRLAVFRGGFGFESAAQVCADDAQDENDFDVFEGIVALLDQSLLVKRGEIEGEPRFLMLETIREFALEQLENAGESVALRNSHRHWCMAQTEVCTIELRGDFARALKRFRIEADNWRAVWSWSLATDPALALQMAADAAQLWNRAGGTTENYERLNTALYAAPNADLTIRCRALRYLIQMNRNRADWATYNVHLQQLEELAQQNDLPEYQAFALDQRMWDTVGAGDSHKALQLGETILELRASSLQKARDERCDDLEIKRLENELHDAMILHVEILADAGQNERAWALMEETLTLKRASGDESGLTFGLHKQAQLLAQSGHFARAHEISEEVVRRAADNDDFPLQRAYYLDDAARNAIHNGDFARARELLRAGYKIWREDNAELGYLMTLTTLARLHEKSRDWGRFAHTLGAIDALSMAQGADHSRINEHQHTPPAAEVAARIELGDYKFDEQRAAGTHFSAREAIELALEGSQEQVSDSILTHAQTSSS